MLILGFWSTYFKWATIIGVIIVLVVTIPMIIQYFDDKEYFAKKEEEERKEKEARELEEQQKMAEAKKWFEEKRKKEEEEKRKYHSLDEWLEKIDNMSGQEFENFLIKELLPLDGYTNINGTSYSGDYGVDIIAENNNVKYAIQCKRYENKISNSAIQEVVAGRKHYRCDTAMVITNSYFTDNAKRLAEDNKVKLIDHDGLIRLIKKYIDNNNQKENK